MLGVIKKAIGDRHRVKLTYEPGERLVEPHAIGYSSQGNILVRAFQVSGATKSGQPHAWKLFRLDRMGRATDAGEEFDAPRPEYNPDDSAMSGGIIARL